MANSNANRKSRARPCDSEQVASFDYAQLDPAFLTLAKPAQRALVNNGILSPRDLAKHSLDEVMAFHGMGPKSKPVLEKILAARGLKFRT